MDILTKTQKAKCKSCLSCAGEARAQFELLQSVGVNVSDQLEMVAALEKQATILLEAQANQEKGG